MRICTPEDLLRPGEQLGTADDTIVMQRVFDRFGRSEHDVLSLPRSYRIERTLVARGWTGKLLVGPGGFTQPTTTGGLTGDAVTSRRCLWIRDGEDVGLCGLSLVGPKTRPGKDRRYEAQHAIHATGVQGLQIDAVRITGVHGDAINVASWHKDPAHTPCRHVTVRHCTVELIGRAGICANDFEHLTVESCEFRDVAATVMLVEAGRRPKTLGPLRFASNSLYDCRSLAVHLVAGGRTGLTDVRIEQNRSAGRYGLAVAADGPDRDTAKDMWPLFRRITIADNRWSSPEAPGRMLRFRDAGSIVVRNNRGPVKNPDYLAWNPPPDVSRPLPFVANCIGITAGPNDLTLAGG